MSLPSAGELVSHIIQAAELVAVYLDGMTRDDFVSDKRTQQAVILNLIVIGEAATKLMDAHPDDAARYERIDWRAMRGMRNRIAHGYYDIDLDVVWETANIGLPVLRADLSGSNA
jgi:uncharacterized protein with HEPN domain